MRPERRIQKGTTALMPLSMDCISSRFRHWFNFKDFNYIQKQCLPVLLRTDENVVVSAPTGSGKTVMFELAMIRAIERGLKGNLVYIAPMRALCAEKFTQWHDKLAGMNLRCVEYSDNCDESAVDDADLIICTPEKLEFNSRTEKSNWTKDIKLVLIDEVHFLNSDRGAALEAVIARLRGIVDDCRFVAVSATIPNVGTIALWLRDVSTRQPAKILKFPDSMRPIPLKTQVIGYYKGNKKAFDFEFGLNYRLPDLINTHSEKKQTLIFCSTRQSTEKTAEILSQKLPACRTAAEFENSKLNYYVRTCGVGFHHAGLSASDRLKVEKMFRENKISVLCATSTLAVGVNLPARLVIIKSTLKYSDSGYQNYDELEVRQMIGRAGRAGFDTEGTAIIMTDSKTQYLYKNISEGKVEVKSRLEREAIADYLNIEIAAQRVNSVEEAHNWFEQSFFAAESKISFSKNNCKVQIENALKDLQEADLIRVQGNSIIPSQMCFIVARNFVSIKTFTYFNLRLNDAVSDDIDCLLQVLCSCPDAQSQFSFRNGDKQHLFKIASDPRLRFPLKDPKLTEPWKKLFLLLQACLQSDLADIYEQLPSSMTTEAKSICDFLLRLLKFAADYFLKKDMATALANVLELQSALAGESWPDDCKLLQQVDGVGRVYARKLFAAGLCDLNDLSSCEESRIEVICGRNPPFGHKVKVHLQQFFPRLSLTAKIKDGVLQCDGRISGKAESIHFLAVAQLDEGSQILHHEVLQKEQVYRKSIKLPPGGVCSISCSLIATSHAGCNRHVTFSLAEPKPRLEPIRLAELPKLARLSEPKAAPKIVPITETVPITPPAKRSVPSPISSEKSVKTKQHFLGNRNMTLASAQSFLQKYTPVNIPPVQSSLFLPKASVQQSLVDEIEIELKSLED